MDTITTVLLVLVAAFALGNLLLYLARPRQVQGFVAVQGSAGPELFSRIEALQQKLELVNTRLCKIEAMISLAKKGKSKKTR